MNEYLIPWVSAIEEAIIKSDVDFFNKIVNTERCGSGGEIYVNGWWSNVFKNQPEERKPENFPTQIAKVPWKNLETDRHFTLNCGIFHSSMDENGFANAEFGYIQNEIIKD